MDTNIGFEKSLINNLSIGIAVTNQQGNILFTNKAIRKLTGYTKKEVRTLNEWFEKAYPDPAIREKAVKSFEYDLEHEISDRTYKITTARGNYKYFNFRYSKLSADKMLYEIIDITDRIKQQQKLENQKVIFENLFTNSLEAILLLDENLKVLDVNKKFEKIFELSKKDVLNKYALDAVNLAEDIKNIKKEMSMVLDGKEWENEVRFKVNGKIKYCNVHIFSVKTEKEKQLTYIAIDDITKSKSQAKELRELKERLELAVDGANIGIWDWNFKEDFVHYNENWAQMLGYDISELNNDRDTWLDLVHPDDKEKALNDIREHLKGKTEKYFNEHRLKTKSGRWKWIRDIGRVTERDESGKALRMVGAHIDIDQEKRDRKEIEYLSNHDELTGLYNRRYFDEEIKRLYNSRQYPISIIVGDLNNLKGINDNHGHALGDKYLKLTAEAIKNSVRAEDLAARVGGDEFAVILPEADSDAAEALVERILNNIEQKNSTHELPKPLSIALGFETADCNNRSRSYENLIKCYHQADLKMYEQKFNVNNFG